MMVNNEKYSIILPGRVLAYYPEDQTADVLVSVERITHDSDETYQATKRTNIKKMPVHTPSGGGWSITMPIKPGDTCVLFFSQIGYDHWWYKDLDTAGTLAGLPKPHLSRQFSEDDGYALVGLNTLPRSIKDYHATHSQWRGPDSSKQVISLNDDETITITSSTKLTINAPDVEVNCDQAVVNATNNSDVNTATANITASSGTNITTPITAISGDVTIGGTLTVTGAVTNLLTVTTSAITTTGGIAIAGGAAADMGSGAMSSTGTMSVNGIDLETHVHPYTWTDGAGAGSTSPPS